MAPMRTLTLLPIFSPTRQKDTFEQTLREHNLEPEQWVQWVSTYTCLVVNTGRHQVLIVPGIHAVAAPGHTPGHMALAISSGGEQLLCISDTALHPIHVEHPDWCAVVDFAPQQVVTTRRRLFKRAANEKALVLGFHFPFPGLGHVIPKGDGWQWQPIETTG